MPLLSLRAFVTYERVKPTYINSFVLGKPSIIWIRNVSQRSCWQNYSDTFPSGTASRKFKFTNTQFIDLLVIISNTTDSEYVKFLRHVLIVSHHNCNIKHALYIFLREMCWDFTICPNTQWHMCSSSCSLTIATRGTLTSAICMKVTFYTLYKRKLPLASDI